MRTADDMLYAGAQKTDALGRPCAISLPVPIILDGVVRDRCPYIGDESVIDLTFDVSEPHFDTQRAMLALFAANQRSDGSIPCSPYNDWSVVLFDYNAYWITALYNYVLYSGDVGFARQVWPNLTRLIDRWYAANTQPSGLLANPLGNYDYAFIHRRGNVVAYYNAQYAFALKQAVQLAGWVGDTAAASRWSQTQQRVVSAFTGAFWNPTLGVFQRHDRGCVDAPAGRQRVRGPLRRRHRDAGDVGAWLPVGAQPTFIRQHDRRLGGVERPGLGHSRVRARLPVHELSTSCSPGSRPDVPTPR